MVLGIGKGSEFFPILMNTLWVVTNTRKRKRMATSQTALTAPKRLEINPVQTETFKGKDAREAARAVLTPDTKPETQTGIDFEIAVCSQEIEVDGKKETFLRAYWRPQIMSIDGILALAESDPVGLIKDANYGSQLFYNGCVREVIVDENSGDIEKAKTFEKLVVQIMKMRAQNNKPVTEEQARKIATLQMEMEVA